MGEGEAGVGAGAGAGAGYRDSAAPDAKVLVIRPMPTGQLIAMAVFGPAIFAGGIIAAVSFWRAWSGTLRWVVPIFSIGFGLMGLLTFVRAIRGRQAKVRLSLDAHALLIEWLHGSRVLRSERVVRGDLQDVMVYATLGHYNRAEYNLVIRTARGDIALKDHPSQIKSYEERMRAPLRVFLGLGG